MLRRLLPRDRHMIIMWLVGSIRARLMFCGYPHVSQCQAHPCWSQCTEDDDASRFEYRSLRYLNRANCSTVSDLPPSIAMLHADKCGAGNGLNQCICSWNSLQKATVLVELCCVIRPFSVEKWDWTTAGENEDALAQNSKKEVLIISCICTPWLYLQTKPLGVAGKKKLCHGFFWDVTCEDGV